LYEYKAADLVLKVLLYIQKDPCLLVTRASQDDKQKNGQRIRIYW